MKGLFKLRGELSKSQELILGFIGILIFLVAWWMMAEWFSIQKPIVEGYSTELPSELEAIEKGIDRDSIIEADSLLFANANTFEKVYPLFPPPGKVFASYGPLIQNDKLLFNTLRSIWINLNGYFWAIVLSIFFGFIIGLIPLFRGLFSKQIDALRYLPLTALTGMFILWFGIYDGMKIAFLAFGILLYLLPIVVQRIFEVEEVYLKTAFTLGSNNWDTIKNVYFPSVMSRLMDDIRVITAISWTYIIIAELLNRQGGLGSLAYIKARQGQVDKVFAILLVFILIGFLQDRIFVYIDKRLFPHKNYPTVYPGFKECKFGIFTILGILAIVILIGIFTTVEGIISTIVLIAVLASLVMIAYGEFQIQKTHIANKS